MAGDMSEDRIARQVTFLREIDQLKTVCRRTAVGDRSRLENSAEHSWHIATMAITLAEHAPPGTDIDRVVRMLLVHDLVEIDAGDTFAYDSAGYDDKAVRERAAADRLFGLLPDDTGAGLRVLWEEFEAGQTPTSTYANALDRFSALLQNTMNGDGGTWRSHGVSRDAVLRRMEPIRVGLPALWPVVITAIDEAAAAGHLSEGRSPR
jgi:putative hydrolase of HD superfamily